MAAPMKIVPKKNKDVADFAVIGSEKYEQLPGK
jgi:hypothetical protein